MHRSEQTEKPRRQRQVELSVPQPETSTLLPVDARESAWSARSRLPYGQTLSRKSAERMIQQRHGQRNRFGLEGLDSQERYKLLYNLANTCTAMIREKQGVAGDVARVIGRSLLAPPIDPAHIQRYFGNFQRLQGSRQAG